MSYDDAVSKIIIPPYSKKQELFNSLSHLLGLPLSLVVIFFAIYKFSINSISLLSFTGLLIFALTIVIVYSFSAIYHYLDPKTFNKKIFRLLDHAVIYLLIAGTYTPICFHLIDKGMAAGLIIIIMEWALALIGILFSLLLFNIPFIRVISLFLYIVMGWLLLFFAWFIELDLLAFTFILSGGITYTIGALIYVLGRKNLNFHSLFHIFVLLSTILQIVGVLLLF